MKKSSCPNHSDAEPGPANVTPEGTMIGTMSDDIEISIRTAAAPGLEYTSRGRKLHYTARPNIIAASIPDEDGQSPEVRLNMKCKNVLLAVIVSLLCCIVIFAQTAAPQQTITLGVCDVMRNLESYSGKTITVRAEVYFSWEITAIGDRQCTVSFETVGRKWPNAFWLAGSASAKDKSIDSRPDDFLSAVLSQLTQLYWRGTPVTEPPYAVSAVFTGVLTTRDKEYWTSHGPAGFGHLNAYPAQLNVIAVRDVTVTPKPAK